MIAASAMQVYLLSVAAITSTIALFGVIAKSKPGKAFGRRMVAAPYWEAHRKHTIPVVEEVTAPKFAELRAENTVQHEQGAVRQRMTEERLTSKIDDLDRRNSADHAEMKTGIKQALASKPSTTTVTVTQEQPE